MTMIGMELLVLMMLLSLGLQERVEEQRLLRKLSVHAKVSEAPFTVALLLNDTAVDDQNPFCTGVIIDLQWVLTAAQCIIDPNEPGMIAIIAGADSVVQFRYGGIQRRFGIEVYIDPRYLVRRVSKYDVAVLRVNSEFEFNDRVNKAALWADIWVEPEPTERRQYGTMQCQVYGWGQVDFETPAIDLRVAQAKIGFGMDTCPCFKTDDRRRLLCPTKDEGYICPGDFGGPLVCQNSVVGIAHVMYNWKSCSPAFFGTDTFECNNRDTVSAWMYICPLLRFIQHRVDSAPEQPFSCLAPHPASMSAVLLACTLLNGITRLYVVTQ